MSSADIALRNRGENIPLDCTPELGGQLLQTAFRAQSLNPLLHESLKFERVVPTISGRPVVEHVVDIKRTYELYRILRRRFIPIPVQPELLRRDNQPGGAARPGHVVFQFSFQSPQITQGRLCLYDQGGLPTLRFCDDDVWSECHILRLLCSGASYQCLNHWMRFLAKTNHRRGLAFEPLPEDSRPWSKRNAERA